MGFNTGRLNSNDIIRIQGYDDAKAYYDNTTAIRGKDKDYHGVPLRVDRKDRNTALKTTRNGDMCIRLSNTDIIVWHKANESITVDVSYNSETTMKWANAYLPYGLSARSEYGFPIVGCYGVYYICKGPMTFTFKRIDNAWKLQTEPTRMHVERLDRKKAKAVREQSGDFYAYLHTMYALNLNKEVFFKGIMKEYNLDPLAQTLVDYGCWNWGLILDEKATKQRYTEAAYRKADAYWIEELPIGTLHKHMRMT